MCLHLKNIFSTTKHIQFPQTSIYVLGDVSLMILYNYTTSTFVCLFMVDDELIIFTKDNLIMSRFFSNPNNNTPLLYYIYQIQLHWSILLGQITWIGICSTSINLIPTIVGMVDEMIDGINPAFGSSHNRERVNWCIQGFAHRITHRTERPKLKTGNC